MDDVMNAVRGEAERVASRIASPRIGIVSSYDPAHYAAKVKLQPEGVETGWASIASMSVGNGFGVFSPPSPGDAVVVIFQEGNSEVPIVLGSLYNDTDRPNVPGAGTAPAGEKWLVHQKGTRVRLTGDGTVELFAKSGTQVKLNPDGTVDIHGTQIRIGAEDGAFLRLVNDTFMALFNSHVHGNGPPPTPLMTAANLTENLKGS